MTTFQKFAKDRLTEVLARNSVLAKFTETKSKRPVLYATFVLPIGECEINISDNITMTCGDRLFECFLAREFTSSDTLVEGFAGRLDRFLKGGSWEEADERHPGPIVRYFQRVFRRPNKLR